MHARAYLLALPVLACLVASGAEPRSADQKAGAKLVARKCAKCHDLPNPNRYTEAEWDDWRARMSRKAKLQPAEIDLLQSHTASLRTNAPAAAPPPK